MRETHRQNSRKANVTYLCRVPMCSEQLQILFPSTECQKYDISLQLHPSRPQYTLSTYPIFYFPGHPSSCQRTISQVTHTCTINQLQIYSISSTSPLACPAPKIRRLPYLFGLTSTKPWARYTVSPSIQKPVRSLTFRHDCRYPKLIAFGSNHT